MPVVVRKILTWKDVHDVCIDVSSLETLNEYGNRILLEMVGHLLFFGGLFVRNQ